MKEQIEGMEKEILKVITQKGNLRHVTIYRKQKEGEWIDKHCSLCGEEEPYTKRGNAFATTFYQFRTNFCPNCGAHMKGADNG